LEQAILGCLEKQVALRYQDVGQLAEALLPFSPSGARERLARIQAVLGAVGTSSPSSAEHPSGDTLEPMPPSDGHPTLRWAEEMRTGTPQPWNAETGRSEPVRSRSWLLGFAAAIAGVLAVTIALLLRTSAGEPADEGIRGDLPSASADTGGGAGASSGGPKHGAPAPATASVQIAVSLEPSNARVELDGVFTDHNPIELPRADRIHALVVSAPGHVSERREVSAQADARLEIHLEREPPPKDHRKRSTARRPTPPRATAASAQPASEPVIQPKGPIADHL
jgi:hypothetical protein